MSRFVTLPLAEVRRETADAVSLAFAIPPEHKDAFRFEPGQYLTLRADIRGDEVRRPYSICSGIDDPLVRVGIKAVPGGAFSTFAQTLEAGDRLDVLPPQGHFRWLSPDERPTTAPCHHLAFAAGSGITPVLSIARSVLERWARDTFTLCYGNRSQSTVMFTEDLHALKDRAMDRFRLHHVFSRELTDVDLQHGRIDAARVETLAHAKYFEPAAIDVVYVCGPETMIEDVRAALDEVGLPQDRIRFERFTAAPRDPNAAPPRPAASAPDRPTVSVGAVVDGLRREFAMRRKETVIAAAERQGVELPYSCAGGMCCTCRCKVVEGAVEMDVCYSLERWELEAGFVLACQAHPTTDRVVLDFDAH